MNFYFLLFFFLSSIFSDSGLVANLLANANAKSPDQCEIDFLKIALRTKKIEYKNLALPPKIFLSVSKKEADRYFKLGRAVWREDWRSADIERLREIARKGVDGETLKSQEVEFLTDRRSSLKELRFLFKALDHKHEVPDELDELATALGKLRDRSIEYFLTPNAGDKASAIKSATLEIRRKAAKEAATRFLEAIEEKNLSRIRKSIRNFEAGKRSDFEKWLKKLLDDSKKIALASHGSPDKLHDLRKNMQAILSVVRLKQNQVPHSEYWKKTYQVFVNVTEKLGNVMGKYEAQQIKGELSFDDGKVEYPGELLREANDLLSRLE